jgi:large subunit ribosomal protein L9
MGKNVKLLLTENVDSLGIVGDVVNVRLGYARNYLLPFGVATEPSEEKIKELAAKRAEAEKELAHLREKRAELVEKLEGLEITIQRSCNDQGVLYGSVTQQDIASALETLGYAIRPRDVRLTEAIKRIDTFDIHLRFDADQETTIKLWVVADRKLDLDEEREDMEFDNEGNLIEKRPPRRKRAEKEAEAAAD